MKMKIVTSLAIAAFLTGCGGANDHPKELLGTWKSDCTYGIMDTITFDSELTVQKNLGSGENCTDKDGEMWVLKVSALYEPDLKTTSSGTEALKVNMTVVDFIITPYNNRSLQQYQSGCPQQSWALGQETSIMECERYISDIELNYASLFYINGNDFYTSRDAGDKDADGYPSDVNYDKPYIKQ